MARRIEAMAPTALIAEDEPLLAANLRAELAQAWPQLRIVATATDGITAVEQALATRPDIVFLDIRMPGMSGLEAAEAIAEDWTDGASLPLVVFVTAYEEYALRAFEQATVDYVLKPVAPDRLARTCERLRAALQRRAGPGRDDPEELANMLERLRGTLELPGSEAAPAGAAHLTVLQASVGATIHMVPVADVLYFEAADKYLRVVTSVRDYLIRTSLRQLMAQLDPRQFWQVHRSIVVRVDAIATATRNEAGKVELALRAHPDKLEVSRIYAHRFKAM
jgi:DNA-binding LytR/AlgR family response regulator